VDTEPFETLTPLGEKPVTGSEKSTENSTNGAGLLAMALTTAVGEVVATVNVLVFEGALAAWPLT
jgi:hypothetical protein